MASPNTGGYEHEFLDPPAKLKEFECPLCLLVTQEPNLTSCCGQHFCQSCIKRILTDRNPCPYCKEDTFTVLLDKKQKRKVLELKVRCSMKTRGCGWMGELGNLATHTDTRNGNCQFVDVVCPNNCGEAHQKRYLRSHILNTCWKRPFACEHCWFWSTYDEVCTHYERCVKFPLICPNKCEIASVERGKMKEHLSECPLQLVECEYAYAGCSEKIQRRDLAAHLEQNVQKHLLQAFAASQRQIAALELKIERIQMEKQQQVQHTVALEKHMEERVKAVKQEMEEHHKKELRELHKQLEERHWQIVQLRDRVIRLENFTSVGLPRASFTVPFYVMHKRASDDVVGQAFYTAFRGAKVQAYINFYNPNDALYVELYKLPGEYDDEIQWPVKCTVTVHLLNQLRDRDHISGSRTFSLTKPAKEKYTGEPDPLKVPYKAIEDRSKPGVQYLQDDCLKFKVYVA